MNGRTARSLLIALAALAAGFGTAVVVSMANGATLSGDVEPTKATTGAPPTTIATATTITTPTATATTVTTVPTATTVVETVITSPPTTTETTPTPPPTTTESTPPPTTPQAAPPAVTAAAPVVLPVLTTVVGLPTTKKCASRRNFAIRLRVPRDATVTSATVKVNGKTVTVRRGARLRSTVNLESLPKGRFTVEITLKLADGRTVKGTRKYRTCAPKKKSSKAPKV
ncbi:MAG: hypothetical protein JHC95_09965 [Solirubrobacteraceae bacterium]|nr:hypothetical protein [Solirubrobacteraceae bacterium]